MTASPQGWSAPGQQQTQPAGSNGCLKWGAYGCGAVLLLGVLAVCSFGYFILHTMKISAPYRTALARAQHDPRVIEALGSPVDAGWWVTGKSHLGGNRGSANLLIPIAGPRGKGTLRVVGADHGGGRWTYSLMVVDREHDPRIDLLNP